LGMGLVGRCGRRWCSAAHRGDGHCCLSCGAVWAGEKRWRGSVVSLGARARGGVAYLLGIRLEVGARRGWHPVRRQWLGATGPAWRPCAGGEGSLIGVAWTGKPRGSSGRPDHGGYGGGQRPYHGGQGGYGGADSTAFPPFEAPWGVGDLGKVRADLGNMRRWARSRGAGTGAAARAGGSLGFIDEVFG
jgi:hypothetical protein